MFVDISKLHRGLLLKAVWDRSPVVLPGAPELTIAEAVVTIAELGPNPASLGPGIVRGREIGVAVPLAEDQLDAAEFDAVYSDGACADTVAAARRLQDDIENHSNVAGKAFADKVDAISAKYGIPAEIVCLLTGMVIGQPELPNKTASVIASLTAMHQLMKTGVVGEIPAGIHIVSDIQELTTTLAQFSTAYGGSLMFLNPPGGRVEN